MDHLDRARALVDRAGLPPLVGVRPLGTQGADTVILVVTLADDREVLLRVRRHGRGATAPAAAQLLQALGVGAPAILAADDSATLVELVPGRTLAEVAATEPISDVVWAGLGRAVGRVHAYRFPAPLQGHAEVDGLVLAPLDPVDGLLAAVAALPPDLVSDHDRERLRTMIMVRADAIRADVPRLCHGDLNLDNVIIGPDGSATLIDWDHPAVRYPLDELSALDEHVFLAGGRSGLPDAFFAGYGHDVPRDLLLLQRVVGCLGWLAGDDWQEFADDPVLTATTKAKFAGWHQRLLAWVDPLSEHLDLVAAGGSR